MVGRVFFTFLSVSRRKRQCNMLLYCLMCYAFVCWSMPCISRVLHNNSMLPKCRTIEFWHSRRKTQKQSQNKRLNTSNKPTFSKHKPTKRIFKAISMLKTISASIYARNRFACCVCRILQVNQFLTLQVISRCAMIRNVNRGWQSNPTKPYLHREGRARRLIRKGGVMVTRL